MAMVSLDNVLTFSWKFLDIAGLYLKHPVRARRIGMQKRWLMGLIGVGALMGTVIGGSAVMAQGSTPGSGTPTATAEETQSPLQRFTSRVAEILGIEQQDLEDAVQQARREMVDQKVQARLDALVEAGRLTQEQADEYLQWFKDRPEDIPLFLGRGAHSGKHGHRHGHPGFRLMMPGGDASPLGTAAPTA
jgi:hypothetical protein